MFTKHGQAFYLHSPCEFQRFSLSARDVLHASCRVELPEGARPIPPPIEEEGEKEGKEEKKDEGEKAVDATANLVEELK